MRFNRKAIETIQDIAYCRCNHASDLHDRNGCHGEVLRFKCERRGHDDFQRDKHGTDCIAFLQCSCRFTGIAQKKIPTGTIVLEDEKK